MAKQYLQPLMMFPAAAGGTCSVYIYNTTTKAALYNPNTLAPISNPVNIDSAGVVDPFVVESGITYDIEVMDSLGNSVWSAERIDIFETVDDVGLQLGESSTTAYRGDRGKTSYDHSQATGNPHGAVAADVGAASALHGDQHGYGESDPVSIDTRQISNMSAFVRTLADDATAADARATLEASPLNTTLANNAGSTTPPTTSAGSLVSKIQSLRDNVVSLFASVASRVPVIAIANQSLGWHQIGYMDLPTGVYGRVYGWLAIVGRGVSAQLQFYVERKPSVNEITPQFLSFSGGPLLPRMSWEILGDGTTIRVRWFVYLEATHLALVSYTVSSSYGAVSSITNSAFVGASLPDGVNYVGNIAVQGSVRAYSLDKSGGADNAPLTGNVQTQLDNRYTKSESDSRYTQNANDESVSGSWTFTATPTIPQLHPESVGGDAADARFVADKIYPNFRGTDITASGSVTLVHGEMHVVNANDLTVTLTNTPVLGTVSWLYYTPVSCSTGKLTLSFTDVLGTTRTYQKSATSGANHLPHWIKCTRCLEGWVVEWETEA